MHVRREWWKSSLLFSSSLLISCGAGPEISTQPFEPDVPTYRLVVVDSFGEEMGDSLTLIGSIEGFCYHHEGCYLVLDGIMGRVRTVYESGPSSFQKSWCARYCFVVFFGGVGAFATCCGIARTWFTRLT